MKFKVTNTVIFHDGKKYKRGDVIDLPKNVFGTAVEAVESPKADPAKVEIEGVKPKAKRTRKKKVDA